MNKRCETTGKRCFSSHEHARKAMKRLSARLRTYECPSCHYWHLTKRTEATKVEKELRRRDE